MTRTRLGGSLVVLGALSAACMDQPAEPEHLANRPSFTFTNKLAEGGLQAVAGGRVQYNGVSHCVWDGEDFETLKCKDQINFQ